MNPGSIGGKDSADRYGSKATGWMTLTGISRAAAGHLFQETSINNKAAYAFIKNAYQAVVEKAPGGASPQLTIQQCVIDNSYDAGVLEQEDLYRLPTA